MALPHARPAQPVAVLPLGAAIQSSQNTALFKTPDLEVIRLVMPQGKEFPSHQVAGDVVVHCLEGAIEITLDDTRHVLEAQHLLHLPGKRPHSLRALQDASALVTIALAKSAAV